MEIDDDNISSPKMEEYNRYMRLHAIVQELSSGSVARSEVWYVEHNHLLHVYDSYFRGGFSGTHPIIEDSRFRENCRKLDILINKLMREFDRYHWFGLYDYLQFNKILIEVIDMTHDYLGEESEEDTMSKMFDGLTV
jgi:hypothetical protein